jgi:hypothetical protein
MPDNAPNVAPENELPLKLPPVKFVAVTAPPLKTLPVKFVAVTYGPPVTPTVATSVSPVKNLVVTAVVNDPPKAVVDPFNEP